MSKKPKTKKLGVAALLNLLGADPNEPIPAGIREAQWHTQDDTERSALRRCPQSGKVSFTSQSQAKQAMRSRLNRGANVSRLRVFHCESCHAWHFTSSIRP